jgi:hypothetical protein
MMAIFLGNSIFLSTLAFSPIYQGDEECSNTLSKEFNIAESQLIFSSTHEVYQRVVGSSRKMLVKAT